MSAERRELRPQEDSFESTVRKAWDIWVRFWQIQRPTTTDSHARRDELLELLGKASKLVRQRLTVVPKGERPPHSPQAQPLLAQIGDEARAFVRSGKQPSRELLSLLGSSFESSPKPNENHPS